jgi:hypothetical protein
LRFGSRGRTELIEKLLDMAVEGGQVLGGQHGALRCLSRA